MSSTVIAGLVLLLSATAVVGTGDEEASSDCVSQQELAAVKAEMERRVDQLHSQLHYWQNVTVNILKDHYIPVDSECTSVGNAVLESTINNFTQSNRDIKTSLEEMDERINQRLDTVEGSIEQIQTNNNAPNQTNRDIKTSLEEMDERLNQRLDTVEGSINDCCNASNRDVKSSLEEMGERINQRLDSMEGSIEQIQTTGDDSTGSFLDPAHNCSHIVLDHPGSPSGEYWVQKSHGCAVKVYCDMERVCGCDGGGGWMRVADINMTRPNENCPAGFRKVTSSGKTMCRGQSSSCISTTFSSHGIEYSQVCGRITGYQYFTTDAFQNYIRSRGSIDSAFVDGIVLTHGSPRQHIWTFAAGYTQYTIVSSGCPCNGDSYSYSLPPYVGNDYFCDSGHRYNTRPTQTYMTNDPLWDGAGCVSGSCCTFNSPPWFCKTLPHQTTDNIELRLCLDEGLTNEDVLFEAVELYVQ